MDRRNTRLVMLWPLVSCGREPGVTEGLSSMRFWPRYWIFYFFGVGRIGNILGTEMPGEQLRPFEYLVVTPLGCVCPGGGGLLPQKPWETLDQEVTLARCHVLVVRRERTRRFVSLSARGWKRSRNTRYNIYIGS